MLPFADPVRVSLDMIGNILQRQVFTTPTEYFLSETIYTLTIKAPSTKESIDQIIQARYPPAIDTLYLVFLKGDGI